MRILIRVLLVCIFTYSYSTAFSQNPRLYLKKAGKSNVFHYFVGDQLRFNTLDYPNDFIRGTIKSFKGDSVVVFNNGEVDINNIIEVDITNKTGSKEFFFYLAGVGFTGIDLLNQKIQGNPFSLHKGVLYASGALITTGLAIKLLKRKKIILGTGWFAFIR